MATRSVVSDRHLSELLATYDWLVAIAGGFDRAARVFSIWAPPNYLGGAPMPVGPVTAEDLWNIVPVDPTVSRVDLPMLCTTKI